jgi:hypothetical protein
VQQPQGSGFINHKQATATGARLCMQEVLDSLQRRGFIKPAGIDAKAFSRHLHHIICIKLAGNDGSGRQASPIDGLHQMADQCRFARAHLTRYHDEAFTLRNAIAKVGQGFAVGAAFKVKMRIRR